MSINHIGPEEIERRKIACIERDDTNQLTHALARDNQNKATKVRARKDSLEINALILKTEQDDFNDMYDDILKELE